MKLKIYFEDIEIGLPQDKTEKKISGNLTELKNYWNSMMENSWILDQLKTEDYDG